MSTIPAAKDSCGLEFLEKTEGNVATPEAESGQRKVNLVEDGGEFLPRSAPDGNAAELGVQREIPLVQGRSRIQFWMP